MGRQGIGEFEELVLLAIAILNDDAYGVAIKQEITERTGRKVSIGALQTAFKRMEGKGFVTSSFGESTAIRGGKRKKYYVITAMGAQVLQEARELRMNMWDAIPEVVLKGLK